MKWSSKGRLKTMKIVCYNRTSTVHLNQVNAISFAGRMTTQMITGKI